MGERERIPIVEEELQISKKQVSDGKVRIRTPVDLVEEVATANLQEQRVEITRVPVDKVVEEVPALRTEGDTIIVPILEEVLVVEKRLVLKEELHIRRRVAQENVEVPVTLRKQRAVIERLDAGETSSSQEPSDD